MGEDGGCLAQRIWSAADESPVGRPTAIYHKPAVCYSRVSLQVPTELGHVGSGGHPASSPGGIPSNVCDAKELGVRWRGDILLKPAHGARWGRLMACVTGLQSSGGLYLVSNG